MKKAALPLYIVLVIGCLACIQTDENLNIFGLIDYYTGSKVVKIGQNTNTIIVAPGAPKIFSCYNLNRPTAHSLLTTPRYSCCNIAAENVSRFDY